MYNNKNAGARQPSTNLTADSQSQGRSQGEPFRGLTVFSLRDFLELVIPEPESYIEGLLRSGSLMMVHARAGAGKTFMMLGLAAAAAYGVPFLGMQTPKRIPVLYVDGEMAADELRNRLKALIAGMCPDAEELGDVHIVSAHLEPHGIPKIDTQQGRAAIMAAVRLNGVKLVILDNLSCLTDPEDENAAGSWSEVQELLLLLRAQGVAVILGHHSTKKGGQRGTSRRLDVLDVVLRLTPDDGAEETCVRCEYEKARSLTSEAKRPFDAVLRSTRNNGLIWVRQGPVIPVNEQVRKLLREGVSPSEIAERGVAARSHVYRIKSEMHDRG